MVAMGAIGLGVYEADPGAWSSNLSSGLSWAERSFRTAPSRNFPVFNIDGSIAYPEFAYPVSDSASRPSCRDWLVRHQAMIHLKLILCVLIFVLGFVLVFVLVSILVLVFVLVSVLVLVLVLVFILVFVLVFVVVLA